MLLKMFSCVHTTLVVLIVSVGISALTSNTCTLNGLYPDETDCTRFFMCSPSGPVVFQCPSGLHFSPTAYYCDWPDLAGCILSASTTRGFTTSDIVESNTSPVDVFDGQSSTTLQSEVNTTTIILEDNAGEKDITDNKLANSEVISKDTVTALIQEDSTGDINSFQGFTTNEIALGNEQYVAEETTIEQVIATISVKYVTTEEAPTFETETNNDLLNTKTTSDSNNIPTFSPTQQTIAFDDLLTTGVTQSYSTKEPTIALNTNSEANSENLNETPLGSSFTNSSNFSTERPNVAIDGTNIVQIITETVPTTLSQGKESNHLSVTDMINEQESHIVSDSVVEATTEIYPSEFNNVTVPERETYEELSKVSDSSLLQPEEYSSTPTLSISTNSNDVKTELETDNLQYVSKESTTIVGIDIAESSADVSSKTSFDNVETTFSGELLSTRKYASGPSLSTVTQTEVASGFTQTELPRNEISDVETSTNAVSNTIEVIVSTVNETLTSSGLTETKLDVSTNNGTNSTELSVATTTSSQIDELSLVAEETSTIQAIESLLTASEAGLYTNNEFSTADNINVGTDSPNSETVEQNILPGETQTATYNFTDAQSPSVLSDVATNDLNFEITTSEADIAATEKELLNNTDIHSNTSWSAPTTEEEQSTSSTYLSSTELETTNNAVVSSSTPNETLDIIENLTTILNANLASNETEIATTNRNDFSADSDVSNDTEFVTNTQNPPISWTVEVPGLYSEIAKTSVPSILTPITNDFTQSVTSYQEIPGINDEEISSIKDSIIVTDSQNENSDIYSTGTFPTFFGQTTITVKLPLNTKKSEIGEQTTSSTGGEIETKNTNPDLVYTDSSTLYPTNFSIIPSSSATKTPLVTDESTKLTSTTYEISLPADTERSTTKFFEVDLTTNALSSTRESIVTESKDLPSKQTTISSDLDVSTATENKLAIDEKDDTSFSTDNTITENSNLESVNKEFTPTIIHSVSDFNGASTRGGLELTERTHLEINNSNVLSSETTTLLDLLTAELSGVTNEESSATTQPNIAEEKVTLQINIPSSEVVHSVTDVTGIDSIKVDSILKQTTAINSFSVVEFSTTSPVNVATNDLKAISSEILPTEIQPISLNDLSTTSEEPDAFTAEEMFKTDLYLETGSTHINKVHEVLPASDQTTASSLTITEANIPSEGSDSLQNIDALTESENNQESLTTESSNIITDIIKETIVNEVQSTSRETVTYKGVATTTTEFEILNNPQNTFSDSSDIISDTDTGLIKDEVLGFVEQTTRLYDDSTSEQDFVNNNVINSTELSSAIEIVSVESVFNSIETRTPLIESANLATEQTLISTTTNDAKQPSDVYFSETDVMVNNSASPIETNSSSLDNIQPEIANDLSTRVTSNAAIAGGYQFTDGTNVVTGATNLFTESTIEANEQSNKKDSEITEQSILLNGSLSQEPKEPTYNEVSPMTESAEYKSDPKEISDTTKALSAATPETINSGAVNERLSTTFNPLNPSREEGDKLSTKGLTEEIAKPDLETVDQGFTTSQYIPTKEEDSVVYNEDNNLASSTKETDTHTSQIKENNSAIIINLDTSTTETSKLPTHNINSSKEDKGENLFNVTETTLSNVSDKESNSAISQSIDVSSNPIEKTSHEAVTVNDDYINEYNDDENDDNAEEEKYTYNEDNDRIGGGEVTDDADNNDNDAEEKYAIDKPNDEDDNDSDYAVIEDLYDNGKNDKGSNEDDNDSDDDDDDDNDSDDDDDNDSDSDDNDSNVIYRNKHGHNRDRNRNKNKNQNHHNNSNRHKNKSGRSSHERNQNRNNHKNHQSREKSDRHSSNRNKQGQQHKNRRNSNESYRQDIAQYLAYKNYWKQYNRHNNRYRNGF